MSFITYFVNSKSSQRTQALDILLLILMMALFFHHQYFWRISPATIRDIIIDKYHINIHQFGHLLSAMYYPFLISQLFSGFLIYRFSLKKVIFFVVLLHLAGCWFFIFSNTFYMSLLGYALIGSAGGVALILALYVARQLVSAKYYPSACAIVITIGMIGAMIGGEPLRWLTLHFRWNNVLFYYSLLDVVIIVFCDPGTPQLVIGLSVGWLVKFLKMNKNFKDRLCKYRYAWFKILRQ